MKKAIMVLAITTAVFMAVSQERATDEKNTEQRTELAIHAIVFGDTIFVMDSSLTYYQSNYELPQFKTIIKKRYANGRLMVSWRYQKNNAIGELLLNSSDSLVFFDDGNMKERYLRYFDNSNGQWTDANSFIYNEDGLPLLEEHKNWDAQNNYYRSGTQYIYEYNDDWQILKKFTNRLDTSNNVWKYSSLRDYYYDENGNDTLVTTLRWNEEAQLWENAYKFQYLFNDQNQKVLDNYYIFDAETQVWNLTNKTTKTYDEYGFLDTLTHYNWYEEYEFWYGDYRQIYSWDEEGRRTEIIGQDFDLPYEHWFNDYKLNWEYEDGHQVFYSKQQWKYENADWLPDEETYNHYNENNKLDTILSKSWSLYTNSWSYINRTVYTFNESGNTERYFSEISLDGSLFETYYDTYYYYSKFITPDAVPELNALDFSIYPNPANSKINILLQQDDWQNTEASILDISGRMVSTINLQAILTIVDISQLKSGVYFIRISNGNNSGVRKVIVN